MMVIQELAETGDDLKFKMAVMPIYVKKNIQTTHSPDLADVLHEAYGALPYIK